MVAVEHLTRQPLADRDLERIYPMPRDTRSSDDYDRCRHRDLPGLADLDLDRAAFGVANRLYHDRDAGRVAWLVERRDAIRAEFRRRRSPQSTNPVSRPSPQPAGCDHPLIPVRGGGRRGR